MPVGAFHLVPCASALARTLKIFVVYDWGDFSPVYDDDWFVVFVVRLPFLGKARYFGVHQTAQPVSRVLVLFNN